MNTDTPPTANASPVFLVGPERAGTTLLRLMLDHHPDVAWCNEFEYAVDRLADDGSRPAMDAYRTWLGNHRIFRATGFTIDPTLDYDALVDSFLRQRRERGGKRLVGATVHRHYRRLLRVWPNARFIHLYRDPRDVARSQVGMGWAGHVYHGAAAWIDAEREREALLAVTPAERHVHVRYETLITQPEAQLRHLCRFLCVTPSERMLRYPETTTYKSPDPSCIEQWRTKMSPREIQLVEGRCGDLMPARGYAVSKFGPATPDAGELARIDLQNRLGRAQFRMRRYGTALWLGEILARRLGWPLDPIAMRRRLDAIDTAHLR